MAVAPIDQCPREVEMRGREIGTRVVQSRPSNASNAARKDTTRGVKLCEFGIPGQGFYSVHVDVSDAKVASTPVRGILTVIQGEAIVGKVVNELKNLFIGLNWEWRVKQLNEKEFLINFPSDEVRSKISTYKSFDFDTCPIKTSVIETGMTEEAIDDFAVVWVKIYGIPKLARSEETVKAIVELVGEFEMLDTNILRRDDPVRVSVACKDPRELHFTIHVYINKVGYLIRWEPEGYPLMRKLFPPEEGDDKDDKGNEDNQEVNLDDEFKNQSPVRGRQVQDRRSQLGSRDLHFAPPNYKGISLLRDVSVTRGGTQGYQKKIAHKKQSKIEVKVIKDEESSQVESEEEVASEAVVICNKEIVELRTEHES